MYVGTVDVSGLHSSAIPHMMSLSRDILSTEGWGCIASPCKSWVFTTQVSFDDCSLPGGQRKEYINFIPYLTVIPLAVGTVCYIRRSNLSLCQGRHRAYKYATAIVIY